VAGETDVLEDWAIGARVGESDVSKLDNALGGLGGEGVVWWADFVAGAEDFADTAPANHGARQ